VVSIIPIIHGGSTRTQFTTLKSQVELVLIKNKTAKIDFLNTLRKKFPNLIIQGISTRFLLSQEHAKKIITISLVAKKKHLLLSKKLETDIIMRFAGTTQISQAIKTVGIKENNDFILILIGREFLLNKLYNELKPFLNLNTFTKNNSAFLKKHFHISKTQMNSIISKTPLEDLLVEKGTILI